MQAVILAGGLGTRLRPHTETIPKPMMIVNGRPFLDLLIERLSVHGIKEAILCTGYLSESIESDLGSSVHGVHVKYSVEESQKGTAHALLLAKNMISQEFLFLFGDTYLRVDYTSLFNEMHSHNAWGVLTAYSNVNHEFKNNLWVNNGMVEKYDKSHPEGNCTDAGVAVFKKKVLDEILPSDSSFEMSAYPKISQRNQLRALITSERFYDIGTPDSLEYFRKHAHELVQ